MAEDIFRACTENVKYLKKQRNRILVMANKALRDNNNAELESITTLYALLYSAYVEVSFLKLIHTPHAFEEAEICQMMTGSVSEKWTKCLELSLKKIRSKDNLGKIANKKQDLSRYLNKYIIQPSQMRNKVAHGQWKVCLNTDCTKINLDTTNEIKNLDFVKIDRLFSIYEKFQQCMVDLALSPRTHYRDYYTIITELDNYISETESWSIESKRQVLQNSPKTKRRKQNHPA